MLFKPEWMLRIMSAVIMGMLLGYERHAHSKEAGIRTHTIVAMASCLLMIISREGFPDAAKVDSARIAAQVVSGVGFLGAGIIFVRQDTIQGLTTAAGIWATSALGLCFGAGMYEIGAFCTIIMFFVQTYFRKLFNYNPPRNVMSIQVHLKPEGTVDSVNKALYSLRYKHTANRISSDSQGGWYLKTQISTHHELDPQKVIEVLSAAENVTDVKILSE